jgi:hypothetical protein
VTDHDPAVQRLRLAYATGKLDITGFRAGLLVLAGEPDAATVAELTAGLPPTPEPRTAGAHKTYPVDMAVLGELAQIGDPVGRAARAAQLADGYEPAKETARKARNDALVSAHVRYKLPQAQCYEPFGILRRPFRTAVRHAPATLPDYGDAARSLAVARGWHARYQTARSALETARLVRDVGIRTLIDGVTVTSAAMARTLDMNTARIAQIRADDPVAA